MRFHGLERAQPFSDMTLVAFVLATPPDAFYREGRRKALLRDALSSVLPPVLRDRPGKTSLFPSMSLGLRERRRRFVLELLDNSELSRRGLVSPNAWRDGVRAFLDGDDGLASAAWYSLTLEMWLRVREGRLPPVA
jgi:hypothetical protein